MSETTPDQELPANDPAPSDADPTSPDSPDTGAEIPVEVATDPLAEAQGEAAKWRDLAARNQAELDNYRKRMAREKSDAVRFANAGLLGELLPILDNFQMGLDAAKAEGEDSVIARGMEMVGKQLNDFLGAQGVEEVPASGAFDPNQHEAVGQEASDTVPEGEVLRVLRRGFRLHDRLLRAANVIVSSGPASGGEGGE